MSDRAELLKQTADDFEKLVDEGLVEWVDCDLQSLPVATVAYVDSMLVEANIGFKVARGSYNGSYFFKLDDPMIGYLHHDPVLGTHMWICPSFKYGLNNQAVFNYVTALKVDLGKVDVRAVHKHNEIMKSRSKEADDE